MQLLMMGTGPFAAPTFEALLASPHDVLALVTRPERSTRGRRKPPPAPMRDVAQAANLPIFDPENIDTDEARRTLGEFGAELFVVCDYGQILKPAVLGLAPLGGINLHGSLLPKYRGAAPVQWAVYHGESETGNTVIQMTPGLDAGPALAVCRTPIGPDETAAQVEARLARMGAPLVLEVLADLEQETATPLAQDDVAATKAPRLTKQDGLVDWTRTSQEIKNQVRAFTPWPATYLLLPQPPGDPLRIILHRVQPLATTESREPGEVLEADNRLVIQTGSDALELVEIQPAGKRAMTAAEFLRGHEVRVGSKL
jgi:methionyl-tRNA formyltransferase